MMLRVFVLEIALIAFVRLAEPVADDGVTHFSTMDRVAARAIARLWSFAPFEPKLPVEQ